MVKVSVYDVIMYAVLNEKLVLIRNNHTTADGVFVGTERCNAESSCNLGGKPCPGNFKIIINGDLIVSRCIVGHTGEKDEWMIEIHYPKVRLAVINSIVTK